MREQQREHQDIIWGRHPVAEALAVGGGRVRRVLVAQGAREGGLAEVLDAAARARVPVEYVPRDRLEQLAHGANHQGVIAYIAPWDYADLDDILAVAARRNEAPLLLALDSVQDVQNLGSLIRSAEAFGAHGIVLPEHRAAGITPGVMKSSAGAIAHLPVAQVTNLPRTLADLQGRGIWVVGLAGEAAQDIATVDLDRPLALVVGSEGKGLGRLVRERCDLLVALPMRGTINSLNAAVAGSIALYLAQRARLK
jgi:23S rRNA (guanosine2251-2'-O)-methyltransferase